ncbi:MAG TPA: DUF1554 domain-containing protein, partial [Leptospiraceae bacterium]|nr:DUF1554 domain-containing protein [Leptospiraceae bacterium]
YTGSQKQLRFFLLTGLILLSRNRINAQRLLKMSITASGLVLTNNSDDDLSVASGSTSFKFNTPVKSGGSYFVAVKTNPTGLGCAVTNASGGATANITNVNVNCNVPKRIFITANVYNGSLGGVSGADTKCSADSNKPSTGTYKALIVQGTTRRACSTANCSGGSSEGIDWVLTANTNYYQKDGSAYVGTTSSAAIFTFSLAKPFSSADTGPLSWTGLQKDWTNSTDNCTSWTTSSAGVSGTEAVGYSIADISIYYDSRTCNGTQSLYCVEQ